MNQEKPITFVTGNKKKLEEIQAILGPNTKTVNKKIDLPELQGEPNYIATEKCKLAVQEIKGPVIIEDVSLGFSALNGLPGPYIKWFLEKMGCQNVCKMLDSFDDKSATAVCTVAYCQGEGKEVHLFNGFVEGTIVPPRGNNDFGWDPIFQPNGYGQTFAEMDPALKNSFSHRFKAIELLSEFLQSRHNINVSETSEDDECLLNRC